MCMVLTGLALKRAVNVEMILADGQGFSDLGSLDPSKRFTVPSSDALARHGAVFVDAHSGEAVCTRARYGVRSGPYARRAWRLWQA
jgi:arylsulfatase A-like enzyme